MKKTLLALLLAVMVVSVLVTAALAQSADPGVVYHRGPFGGNNPNHPLHPYMVEALASALKMNTADVEAALAEGKTMYDIALAAGTAEADIPSLLQTVHQTALTKAVEAGVITQAQADWMLQRMAQRGYGYGAGAGTCPMGGTRPQDGTGMMHGRGMHGGRWQQQTTP
ncbi:MAG: hypothetical protein WHV44_05905 [Anaerolineales bacterium]